MFFNHLGVAGLCNLQRHDCNRASGSADVGRTSDSSSTRIQAVDSDKVTHRAALAELDALFAALQHRAFAGQL